MHPLRCALALLFLALLGFAMHVAADTAPSPGSPAAVVQSLYRACLDHSTGFNAESVKLAKPWVAPDLYARILKKLNQPTPKGEAPDIEGDIFLDAQEPPSSFTVRETTSDLGAVSVEVILKWPHEKRRYYVLVLQIDGVWKVIDVNYGKDGTLRNLLK